MRTLENYTCTHKIWMAGDFMLAKSVVQEYCDEIGDCYTITETDYIFTNGTAAGFCIGRIQYPKFAISSTEIYERTFALAIRLKEALCQTSFTIEGPDKTVWYSD